MYLRFLWGWTQPGQSQRYKQSSRNCRARSLQPCSLLRSQFPRAKCGFRLVLGFFEAPRSAAMPAWRRPGQQTASLRREAQVAGESERSEGRVWEHLVFQQKWRMREENLVQTQATRAQWRGSSSSFAKTASTMSSFSIEKPQSSSIEAWFSVTTAQSFSSDGDFYHLYNTEYHWISHLFMVFFF
ncbi:hypothetical protein V8G54_030982, partial [Vigna mungo]